MYSSRLCKTLVIKEFHNQKPALITYKCISLVSAINQSTFCHCVFGRCINYRYVPELSHRKEFI